MNKHPGWHERIYCSLCKQWHWIRHSKPKELFQEYEISVKGR